MSPDITRPKRTEQKIAQDQPPRQDTKRTNRVRPDAHAEWRTPRKTAFQKRYVTIDTQTVVEPP